MNALMKTLQQPLTVAALAHCLGFGAAKRTRARASRRSRLEPDALPALDGEDDAAHPSCGWFDSSHELHQGLLVLEHSGAQGLGSELPVTVWLQLVLDGPAATQGMIHA